MAISPKQLEVSFDAEADFYERVIDRILETKSVYKGQTINVDPPQGMKVGHWKILIERYLKAGWSKVSSWNDQRDGWILEFTY